MKHKIYLAGKITRHGWRDAIVNQCHMEDNASYEDARFQTSDCGRGITWIESASTNEIITLGSWRLRVSEYYDITGPFFVGEHYGQTHDQSTHASQVGYENPKSTRKQVRRLCLDAIRRSDVMFVWLDDLTAYGTIAEIGYAHALGKRIVLGFPPCPTADVYGISDGGHGSLITCDCIEHGDTWFVAGMVNDFWDIHRAVDATTAWDQFIETEITFQKADRKKLELRQEQNEVELMFWDEHEHYRGPEWIHDLEPQHEIIAGGKKYRLDFYSPSRQCAIEVDGLAYHNGQKSFIADRERQRTLEMTGIRVLRFAAKEVMEDAYSCYKQAVKWAENV